MELIVVSETRRPLDWFYDVETKSYVRRERDGKLDAKIYGRFLPDPHLLEEVRAERGAPRVQCDPVTHVLWKHWTTVAIPMMERA